MPQSDDLGMRMFRLTTHGSLGARWLLAGYALADATYQSALQLTAPEGDPAADAGGRIDVRPGDHLSGIPLRNLKLGLSCRAGDDWRFDVELQAVGRRYYGGDESNQDARLPGHATLDLHASWQVLPRLRLRLDLRNALDRRYASFGTWYDTDSPLGRAVGSDDPRSLTPGRPRALYATARFSF
ncbi:MAG TPA: TonB-dependent receptor [Rhodanobacteraceae bacterium]|nr:TonB-dependent receptor [Rhodanobacteraceae bacterium]